MVGEFAAAGAVAVGGVLVFGAYYPNSNIYGPVVGRGKRDSRSVYLTFDDGPNPKATEPILRVLEAEGVSAGFFMVGRHAHHFPDVARAVAAAGHLVGNHTQNHQKLHLVGPRRIRDEIAAAHDTISAVIGRAPQAFRAPHGYRNMFVRRVTRRFGYPVFGWTYGVWDSARPGVAEIRRRVRKKLAAGAIVLLHDGDGYDMQGDRTQTAEALPAIINDAREAGYEFRPLSDLVAA